MYVLPLIRVALHYPSPTRERNASARRYKSNAIVPASPARSSTASTFKSRCRRSAIRTSPVATLANRTEIIASGSIMRATSNCSGSKRSIHANAQMGARDIKRYCAVNDDAEKLLETAVNKLGLSAHAYSRVLKVGRTIADLAGAEEIQPAHIGRL